MSQAQTGGVNESFEPNERQRAVLEILREEYRANPYRFRQIDGVYKQKLNLDLNTLQTAGWVRKVNRGLYELVYDGECYVEQDVRCIEAAE